MFRGIFFAVLTFVFPLCAAADPVEEVQFKTYWLCKNQKQVRTIRVLVKSDGTCSTVYSKMGEEKVVGSGRNHSSCDNFLNNVKTNLEKSNWACRDISSARVTAGISDSKPQ